MSADLELIEAAGAAMSRAMAREADEYLLDTLCAMSDPDAPRLPTVTKQNWRTWRHDYWAAVRAYRQSKEHT